MPAPADRQLRPVGRNHGRLDAVRAARALRSGARALEAGAGAAPGELYRGMHKRRLESRASIDRRVPIPGHLFRPHRRGAVGPGMTDIADHRRHVAVAELLSEWWHRVRSRALRRDRWKTTQQNHPGGVYATRFGHRGVPIQRRIDPSHALPALAVAIGTPLRIDPLAVRNHRRGVDPRARPAGVARAGNECR